MNKKKYLLFTLALFFLLFHNTNAATRCYYSLNGENIILEKEEGESSFNKVLIKSPTDISIAENNVLKETYDTGQTITGGQVIGEAQCPVISVSISIGALNQEAKYKIFSSKENCEKDTLLGKNCVSEITGVKVIGEESSENLVGKNQAALVDRGDTFCIYESGDRYRFTVTAEDGRNYEPDLKCKDKQNSFCTLKSNDRRFFYNSGNNNIKCPSYIYYECKIGIGLISTFTNKCNIIGSGGNADNNYSETDNPIKGDEPVTVNPPLEIEQGPLDCDKMFQGPFGDFLKDVWNLIKFAVPILIIALSIVDFVKSLTAQDEAEIKKAANKLIKRLVIGVLIFVLPTIIELLLHLAGIEYGTCNIK